MTAATGKVPDEKHDAFDPARRWSREDVSTRKKIRESISNSLVCDQQMVMDGATSMDIATNQHSFDGIDGAARSTHQYSEVKSRNRCNLPEVGIRTRM